MEKYIEEIIEIFLDNVSCDHIVEKEYPGRSHHDVTYSLDNEQEVIKKAMAALPARLVEKPLVTKEWIEEKASGLAVSLGITDNFRLARIKNFICSLLNELAAKINLKGD